jgi:hypothetical protein
LGQKRERKRSLGRLKRQWEETSKMDLEKKYDQWAWTGLIWLRTGMSEGLL